MGAALGVAVFGTIFTSRLAASLSSTFSAFGASPADAGKSTASLDPQLLSALPGGLRDAVVNAYADSLAPVFWYLIAFLVIAFLLALTLKETR